VKTTRLGDEAAPEQDGDGADVRLHSHEREGEEAGDDGDGIPGTRHHDTPFRAPPTPYLSMLVHPLAIARAAAWISTQGGAAPAAARSSFARWMEKGREGFHDH